MPQQGRDLVLAAFSSMVGLSGILLALMGFVVVRYDALKRDTFTTSPELAPLRLTLVGIVVLMVLAAAVACSALVWLLGLVSFEYPMWLVGVTIIAVPVLGGAVLKLRL